MSKKNQKAKYQDQKAKAKYEDLKANYQRVFTEARKKQVKDLCPWWNLDEIFEAEDEEEKLNRAIQEEARDLFAEVKYVADFYKSNPKAEVTEQKKRDLSQAGREEWNNLSVTEKAKYVARAEELFAPIKLFKKQKKSWSAATENSPNSKSKRT